ncbi:MAG: metallophosphoesterase [Phycisphaerales bacterium]
MTDSISALNIQNADAVCDLFDRAAQAALDDPKRKGSSVFLPQLPGQLPGALLITGDLHDHRINLRKIINLADLSHNPARHLVMQELIHGPRLVNGMDLSYRTSAQVAELQLQYPGRVHVLLGNHELSQIGGVDIAKHGVSVVDAFHAGLDYVFGDDADRVHEAYTRWVKTNLLAVRCANGLFCSHSLPAGFKAKLFDPAVLERLPTDVDYSMPNGSAHLLVWGRNIDAQWAKDLAKMWDVEQFVLGHQPAEMGYEEHGENMLILASDHDHGVALPIDLSRHYTRAELLEQIIPLAAVGSGE